jgi:hypothetical protein
MGWIYLIRNKYNGKCYIGQSRRKCIEERWKQHRYRPHNGYLKNAFKSSGIENFEFSVLYEIPNEELDEIEIREIEERNTLAPNGYNLEKGGNNKKEIHPETREKLRRSHLGHKLSDETKLKMSESQKKIQPKGKDNWRFGTHRTNIEKDKISKTLSKKIDKMSLEGEFIETILGIKYAAALNGCNSSGISLCCNGKRNSAGGFKWKYH